MRTHAGVLVLCVLGAAVLLGGGGAAAAPEPPPELLALAPDHGPVDGGHVVTVTGTGFVVGDTAVFFDGTRVAASVVSATELTFVAPPHQVGTVSLTVRAYERSSAGALHYVIESPRPTTTPSPTASSTASPTPSAVPGEVVAGDDPPRGSAPQPERPAVVRDLPRPERPTLAATGSSSAARTGVVGLLVLALGVLCVLVGRERPRGATRR